MAQLYKRYSADFQVFTEDEVSNLTTSLGQNVFPYGFVTRSKTNTSNRTLAANPNVNDYDGVVTLAARYPLQANSDDDLSTIYAQFVVVDDDTTRVTESLEEQTNSTRL